MHIKISYFLFIFFFCSLNVIAQENLNVVDSNVAVQIPEIYTRNTKDIAQYISTHYTSQHDKVKALYQWLSGNFSYDVENMFKFNPQEREASKITKILKSKKGVCEHYALLFHEVCIKMNLNSHIVYGYTRQYDKIDSIPHAWNACMIDDAWYLFDPTWGAGYIQDNKFVPKLNMIFFETNPVTMLKTHMPYDPFWQLVHYPIRHQNFHEGNTELDSSEVYYNYADSIKEYENQIETVRLKSSIIRLEDAQVNHHVIKDRIEFQKKRIENIRQNELVDIYNAAIKDFNSAVNDFNRFIQFRNRQFKPEKTGEALENMVSLPLNKLDQVHEKLSQIINPDKRMQASIASVEKQIKQLLPRINEQQEFVKLYLSKNKVERKALFIKTVRKRIP